MGVFIRVWVRSPFEKCVSLEVTMMLLQKSLFKIVIGVILCVSVGVAVNLGMFVGGVCRV